MGREATSLAALSPATIADRARLRALEDRIAELHQRADRCWPAPARPNSTSPAASSAHPSPARRIARRQRAERYDRSRRNRRRDRRRRAAANAPAAGRASVCAPCTACCAACTRRTRHEAARHQGDRVQRRRRRGDDRRRWWPWCAPSCYTPALAPCTERYPSGTVFRPGAGRRAPHLRRPAGAPQRQGHRPRRQRQDRPHARVPRPRWRSASRWPRARSHRMSSTYPGAGLRFPGTRARCAARRRPAWPTASCCRPAFDFHHGGVLPGIRGSEDADRLKDEASRRCSPGAATAASA